MTTLKNAFAIPALRKKMIFTFLMITILAFASLVPCPGVDVNAFRSQVKGWGDIGNLMGILSGKAIYNASIISLSVYPYLIGMIIVQILSAVIPSLRNMSNQNEAMQRLITKMTRIAAIIAGFVFSVLMVTGSLSTLSNKINFWLALVLAVLGFTIGSALVSWICELISSKGLGNGFSVVIFAAICRNIPHVMKSLYLTTEKSLGMVWAIVFVVLALVIGAAALIFCVYIQSAERRIKILFNKRSFGMKQYMGQNTSLPIKITQAGILPIIYAMMLLTTPALIIAFYNSGTESRFALGFINFRMSPAYIILFAFFILILSNAFSLMQFNPNEIANELKNNGGYIAGIKPGKPTMQFLMKMFSNMNYAGALYLFILCVIPMLIAIIPVMRPFWYAGIAIIILSTVVVEMVTLLDNGIKEEEDKKKSSKPTKNVKAFKQ